LPAGTTLRLHDGVTSICGPTPDAPVRKHFRRTILVGRFRGGVNFTAFNSALNIGIIASNNPVCPNPPGGNASDHGGTCPTG